LEATPGENEVVITGRLFFARMPESREVDLVATADSCLGFEVPPAEECRVLELNEANNDSPTVHISLPASEPTPTPMPTPTPTPTPTTPPPDID
jgi:hypothetical protein